MKNINILKDLKTLNELHAPSVESHTTNNGIVDFTCDNAGYVDNVVIEGETLVNLYKKNMDYDVKNGDNSTGGHNTGDNYEHLIVHNFTGVETFVYSEPITQIQQGKEYTLIVNVAEIVDGGEKVGSFDIYHEGDFIYNGYSAELVKVKFTSKHNSPRIRFDANRLAWVKFKDIIILEGDHTDKPISYFEGLKSVGQGDKIDVLTYPTNNENLITSDVTLHEDYCVSWGTGELVSWVDSNEKYYATDYIEVEPNTEYIFANINKNIAYYDTNKTFIPMPLSEGYNEKNCTYFYNTSPSNAKYVRLSIKNMYIGKPYMAKGKYICDKKQISTTLRSLPNGVKDTIEKRGNKYVKVQRCGEVTLNGNEQVGMYISNGNTAVFGVIHKGQTHKRGLGICDKLRYHMAYNTGEEHFYLETDNTINIEISLSKLSSANEEGFKTWLQSNPITVVYELETPQIIELPNFNLQTYKGDNALLINSGVIQCDASFDVCEGIRSELDVIKDKVSSLDDYESGYEFSNEVIYLNGTYKPGFAETPYIVRIGKICILHCAIGNDAPQRGMHVLKLPSFAKPKDHHRCAGRAKINDETINPILVDYDITLDNTVQIWTTHETTKLNEMYIHMIWEVE